MAAHAKDLTFVLNVEGTLVDCVADTLESWRETLEKAGHHFDLQELHRYSGMDGSDMLDRLLPDAPSDHKKQLLKAQGERYRESYIARAQPFPRTREAVAKLKDRGCRLGIATTCQKDELAVYDRAMHIVELVDVIVCGDDVKKGKPHADLFLKALRKLGDSDPSCTIALGDTPYDAQAAGAAGLRCIGVLSGGFPRADLRSAGCEAVLDTIGDLLAHVLAVGATCPSGEA